MSDDPLKDDAEVEIVCPRCGYRTTRTAARLRRDTMVVCPECGAEIVPPDDEEPPPPER
jgi:DNA-directed RNA polymerase subunit RPC12/RpoP